MGCVSIREKISKEEDAIISMENQLEFFKNNSLYVDGIIRKYSKAGTINSSQWVDIYTNLEIKIHNTSTCPQMENFYGLLRKNELFCLRDLLILGLLLSNGLARQKARLFFEIYDEESTDQLGKAELEAMIDDIARFSIRLLPKLVDNSTNPPVSRTKVALYAKELDQLVPAAKENLISSILGSQQSIRTHDFANLFNNDENGQLLTPHGFRKYVLNS